jgi:hypothetical protein
MTADVVFRCTSSGGHPPPPGRAGSGAIFALNHPQDLTIARGAAAADGIDNDFLQLEPFGIGNLNILIGDELRQAVDVDGGVVAVDGVGGAQSQLVFTLANISETPLMIFDLDVSGPGADQFTVPTIAHGTVIGGFESISLPITFDPTKSGSQILNLVFHTDGAVPVVGTQVTALGLAPDGDLLIDIPNNNVGGQRIDDDSQFIADFAMMTNIGETPLTIRMVRVVENDDEFRVSGMPAGFGPSQPLVLAPHESFTVNLEYRMQRLGLQRGIVQFVTDDPDQQIFSFTIVGTGMDSDAPEARLGDDFVAISTNIDQRPALVRSDAAGDFPLDLPPNTPFELTIFDPETGLVALEINATPDQGVAFDGLTSDFAASVEPDSDGDGLPDDIELAIGSDPHSRDTNRDGIDDFQSIAGGIDPVNPNLSPPSSMTFATSIPATKAAAQTVETTTIDTAITATEPGVVVSDSSSVATSQDSTVSTTSTTLAGAALSAAELNATVGILNGSFLISDPSDQHFGWGTNGDVAIVDGRAVLGENSVFNAALQQTFVMSEDARTLRFTIVSSTLGVTDLLPGDAFEMALLDAASMTPAVGTAVGLANTDALVNIQHDGTIHLAPNVTVLGVSVSGSAVSLATPTTILIDVSSIKAGTILTAYFDLLGFGDDDALVAIDNVLLLSGDAVAPIADDDTATTPADVPVVIDVLANDDDPDGALDPATVALVTAPTAGSTSIDPSSGKITYTPAAGASGDFVFTYTVADDTGLVSNEATVTVTVDEPVVAVPLSVVAFEVNAGDAQRSNIEQVTVSFNRSINFDNLLTEDQLIQAVRVVNLTIGAQTSLANGNYQYDASTWTLTIDLTVDSFGGSQLTALNDGRYEVQLDTTLIAAADDGTALSDEDGTIDALHRLTFHRLLADFNGDAKISRKDLGLLREHYRSRVGDERYDFAFDLDSDGKINRRDYLILRRRKGHSI